MFDPQEYKDRPLTSLLEDLDALPSFPDPERDHRRIPQSLSGPGPDLTEYPTTAYEVSNSTDRSLVGDVELPNIDLKEYLGAGKYGWVYEGRVKSSGLCVAVKILKKEYADSGGAAAREALIASSLRHPNILGVFDVTTTSVYWVMIIELVRGESFSHCRCEKVATMRQLRFLASAVNHMAASGVVHRDIKPANIMLRQVDKTPVIVDFGMAIKLDTYHDDGLVAGTPYFMCPDALRGEAPSAAFDAYSLGITFAELMNAVPRTHGSTKELFDMKREGRFDTAVVSKLRACEGKELHPYVCGLIHQDPLRRIETVSELAKESVA